MKVIGARKTTIKTLTVEEAQNFLNLFHRAKALKVFGNVNLGIFHGDVLLGVAQFGYPRTNDKQQLYSAELYRLAFHSDYRVPGGASKLIKHYIREYKPADFFTYQDTSGEATAVYEHAGMTLVSQAKKKQYLVAPGKTLETGSRKEVLGMAYATRYGPDRILGAKLGEVFREDGTRKSNKDIFIEELGWHIEETSGDRVYEWVNPERTYYTYKITATDSDKYYYGVSHVKKANASLEDCLNDGYYGSGGINDANKYRRWKAKHASSLVKEVIERFSRKSAAYEKEKELIGTRWLIDPLCLNSVAGGRRSSPPTRQLFREQITVENCPEHGETTHVFNICAKCKNKAFYREKVCPLHGSTIFWKNTCRKCMAEKSFNEKECDSHGLSFHHGDKCVKCVSKQRFKTNLCSKHGETLFLGKTCHKCMTQDIISEKLCAIHGMTKFRGENCYKCMLKTRDTEDICPIHGPRSFRGGKCMSCIVSDSFELLPCPSHGITSFLGGKCKKCTASGSVTMKECSIHGKVKHKGDSCARCLVAARDSIKECVIHGAVKHSGDKCRKCSSELGAHRRFHSQKKNINCRFCSN